MTGGGTESPTFTLGQAIYIAVKPLFKIYLTMALGFLMARRGVLDADTSRVISRIVLTYLLPCLIFSNIVGNIKDTDIKLLGIILLTSYLYFAIGGAWAFFIRLTTPIPKAWFGGLILASVMNNSGDLPIAYVQTLGDSEQFPSNSKSVGTAYCVLYSIGFLSFTFNLGGARLIRWDASHKGSDKFDPTIPPFSLEKLLTILKIKQRPDPSSSPVENMATHMPADIESSAARTPRKTSLGRTHLDSEDEGDNTSSAHLSEDPVPINMDFISRIQSRRSFATASEHFDPEQYEVNANTDVVSVTARTATDRKGRNRFTRAVRRSWTKLRNRNVATKWVANFLEDLLLPQALAIIVSITVAMIPWVKRLFVQDPAQYVKGIPNAPDGNPPLDFFMNFTQFIGQTQVQFGLMLLGATISRLRIGALVRGFWKTVLSITLFKLVILPIIALAWVSNLRKMGWIDMNDPMAVIVLVASSATPSATVQIYLTLLHSDPNEPMILLNSFAVILIVDYVILPITMTIVMTYTLMNVL